ncbi:uncharacterized protein LOC134202608 [Armigeres subalbatus]|uniref:uncharacterized protein LOC134202608 n=1 Tax=Armigeres subalbatus TaxID=124917 RepID=UPI002ED2BBF8
MASADKKRAKNFTKDDVELLTELVFRFRNVIENKKTDGVTTKQKNEAWIKIAAEFSASASHPRNADQLKNYYKNTKSTLKKELAKEKSDLFRTGGGAATMKRNPDNPIYALVQQEVTPLSNPYDSSSTYFNEEPQASTSKGSSRAFADCFEEFVSLGGDPNELGDSSGIAAGGEDTNHTEGAAFGGANTGDPGGRNSTGAPGPGEGTTSLGGQSTGVVRNNKRQRMNFNTLREYVGELGHLKKKKYELQCKLLELSIKKMEREIEKPEDDDML